jgi:hypothetical protein
MNYSYVLLSEQDGRGLAPWLADIRSHKLERH